MAKYAVLFILVLVLSVSVCVAENISNESYRLFGSITEFENSELPQHQQALEAWKYYNIDSFSSLSISRTDSVIELLDSDKYVLGKVSFKVIDDNFETIELEGLNGLNFLFKFHKSMTFFSLLDKNNGEYHESSYDTMSNWTKSDQADQFFNKHENIMILMLSVHSMFVDKNNKVANLIYSSCYGSYYRGFGTGSSKSLCCQDAINDVNVKCSNSYCYGCCSLLSCDAVCGVGDYVCSCGISGRACSS